MVVSPSGSLCRAYKGRHPRKVLAASWKILCQVSLRSPHVRAATPLCLPPTIRIEPGTTVRSIKTKPPRLQEGELPHGS